MVFGMNGWRNEYMEKKIRTTTKKQSREGPQATTERRVGSSKALILSEESVNVDPDASQDGERRT